MRPGIAVGSGRQVFSFIIFCISGFSCRHLEFSEFDNVGQCRQYQVVHGPICRGRSSNRGAIGYRSNVISISGLVAVILNIGFRTTSRNAGCDVGLMRFGMVENVGHR